MTAPRQQHDEPTRDEIREACEAVGWEWVDLLFEGQPCAWDPSAELHWFGPGSGSPDADALALLEATGEDFQINYDPRPTLRYPWDVCLGPEGEFDPPSASTLRAAAVRAVNSWSRSKR